MTKTAKKRGRPAIKPYIEGIIVLRVLDEQKKPQEVRMPPKVLAHEIQKEIKEHIKQGDRLPALSTLEKRISGYANKNDPQDEPWSLLALANYDISAEALPAVFDLWAYALRDFQKPLTIREIKWAARLYRITRDDKIGLLLSATRYAAYEKACETLEDKFISIANEVVFHADTELYADTHLPGLTTEELLEIRKDPDIQKRKRQKLLEELRSPEILRNLGLENLIPNPIQVAKKKRRQGK